MSNKTEYIAPFTLWLVVRKRFRSDGLFVEPAWVGDAECSGPVVFASRIHAHVYATLRNTYHQKDDSNNWNAIPLHEFDLLDHVRALDGRVNCQMAFGFCTDATGALIVAKGAPRLRYANMPFEIPNDMDAVTFNFNQWVFDFMREEWASNGASSIEHTFDQIDGLDAAAFSRVAAVAVANARITRDGTNQERWTAYHPGLEQWVSAETPGHRSSVLH